MREDLDVGSVVDLARMLISVPSQGGIDPPEQVIGVLSRWLAEHGLTPRPLSGQDGAPVGLFVDIGTGAGPHYCLNACLDTAPFGDPAAWADPPTAGVIRAGWLAGRGTADCKTAVAVFCHIGVELASRASALAGTLTLLFDADEHTGHFGGVRAYTGTGARPDGVLIGYPGQDEIVVGARGFWRAQLHVSGGGGHSGSRRQPADNAVVKAAALVRRLNDVDLPSADGGDFPLGPRLTTTGISGGEGYSIVPDRCVVSVDVRLTPRYDAAWAESLVRDLCRSLDEAIPSRAATMVEPDTTWPAYRLQDRSPVATALRDGAQRVLRDEVPVAVAGPSNIGNYLATMGIEATCGFGVTYRDLHAANEAIDLTTVPTVYAAYRAAVTTLLGSPG